MALVLSGKTYNAYGEGLFWFLNSCQTINKGKDGDIWTFGHCIFDRRNELFHQLAGLQAKEAVFQEWQTSDEQSWKIRVLNCLNFVSGEKFEFLDQAGSDGSVASLMVQVRQELEKAIADF